VSLIRQDGEIVDVPPPPRIWKTGQAVRITTGGRTVDGEIALASNNGVSLFLTFEAMLDPAGECAGYLGGMPAMWNGAAFQDLAGRGVIEIEERA
jgi:hypothetical protein